MAARPGSDAQNLPARVTNHMRGAIGYLPTHPQMRATFIIAGPGIPKKGSLGEIDMRDIAPTLATLLKVSLPQAEGHGLF